MVRSNGGAEGREVEIRTLVAEAWSWGGVTRLLMTN